MCGIIGWWKTGKIDKRLFNQMRDKLSHRGPDGYGSYFSEHFGTALGHRRLSFLDMSDNGKQPMSNEDETIWITVNGEIYNYLELREILIEKGHVFKSKSDSEVIIHGYEEWGEKIISKLEGMFAFGLWDEKKQKLIVARDPFGIKPLYYYKGDDYKTDGEIIFASEIKAIIENKKVKRRIDYSALCDYLTYRFIPSPKSIFRNISKVEPGHYIEFSEGNISDTQYYNLRCSEERRSKSSLTEEMKEKIKNSVDIHKRSDTPVGAFLSGGIDSSTIVKYASKDNIINTFSIGFEGWRWSEHKYAEKVAEQFKTHHRSLMLDEFSFQKIDEMSYWYDEPMADISIIPTYQLCRFASIHNKAVLSGEGGDEIFGGYKWYKDDGELINKNRFDIESYSSIMSMGKFDNGELKKILNKKLHEHIPDDTKWFYRKNMRADLTPPKNYQVMDMKGFMSELVLTKVDRASMANSLEVRVPFLNKDIVETALKTHPRSYMNRWKNKVILDNILNEDMSEKLRQRKKQGFSGPKEYYTDLEWYREQLKGSHLVRDGILEKKGIEDIFYEKDGFKKLWKILVLEKWYRRWVS